MNKINSLFANKGDKKLLSLYFCSGCPKLDCTGDVIKAMERRGIDFIEVGIPFSDPMADGPVIQDAATMALRNGQTLKNLFSTTLHNQSQFPNPFSRRQPPEGSHPEGSHSLLYRSLSFFYLQVIVIN